MSTNDVPGANDANNDVLAAGCWAEHEDGSLLFVKGTEGGQVVYELYDIAQDPPVSYQDAMLEDAFKRQFSFPPVGSSPEKWTWHIEAAERDGDDVPSDIVPVAQDSIVELARRPRCLSCGRFIKRLHYRNRFPFCSPEHAVLRLEHSSAG